MRYAAIEPSALKNLANVNAVSLSREFADFTERIWERAVPVKI
jgi:hypothetical protein